MNHVLTAKYAQKDAELPEGNPAKLSNSISKYFLWGISGDLFCIRQPDGFIVIFVILVWIFKISFVSWEYVILQMNSMSPVSD